MEDNYRKFLEGFLTQAEIEDLGFYNERPNLKSAIRKILLAQIYFQGVVKKGIDVNSQINFLMVMAHNPDLSDAQVGADMRQRAYACRLVETSLDNMEEFKKYQLQDIVPTNPAV